MRSLLVELVVLGAVLAAGFFFWMRPVTLEAEQLRAEQTSTRAKLAALQEIAARTDVKPAEVDSLRGRYEERCREMRHQADLPAQRRLLRRLLAQSGTDILSEGPPRPPDASVALSAVMSGDAETPGLYELIFEGKFVSVLQVLEGVERDPEFPFTVHAFEATRQEENSKTRCRLVLAGPSSEPASSRTAAPGADSLDDRILEEAQDR